MSCIYCLCLELLKLAIHMDAWQGKRERERESHFVMTFFWLSPLAN